MIIYDRLWRRMSEKGITSYALRETYGIDGKTLQRMRHDQNTTTKTLNELCKILDCNVEDIMEYIPDQEG